MHHEALYGGLSSRAWQNQQGKKTRQNPRFSGCCGRR